MKFRKYLVSIVSGMIVLLFSGCTKVPNLDYNAQMNRDIHTIAIIPPKKIEDIGVFYFNHPGTSFGLIGGLAAAAEFSSKKTAYNNLIKSTKFDANRYFMERLSGYLKGEGYRVLVLPYDKRRDNDYMKKYPNTNADALLDVVVLDLGYIAGSPSSSYKPTVRAKVKMIKRGNHTTLYEKYIGAGESFALSDEADYAGDDTAHHYKDFDALKKDAQESVEGIKKALDMVAKHIADALKKSK